MTLSSSTSPAPARRISSAIGASVPDGAVLLDATTQPGYSGTPLIQLDGTNAGANANGLTITATDVTVQGFAIGNFTGDGIELLGPGATQLTIASNFIGTTPAGTAAFHNASAGIEINGASNNTIGGTTAGAGNLISGNTGYGIMIDGTASTGNFLADNLIGTVTGGAASLPNGNGALSIANGAIVQAAGTFTGNVADNGTLDLAGNNVSIDGCIDRLRRHHESRGQRCGNLDAQWKRDIRRCHHG